MKAYITMASVAALSVGLVAGMPAAADPFFFSTGNPDGKLGSLSRPGSGVNLETETADDFVLTRATVISRAIIHGLIPSGLDVSSIQQVEIELYHVFPKDSDTTRTPQVVTRVNSPADVEIGAATRDSSASPATLSFGATVVNESFMVLNTVVNKINKAPNQFTGGEGPATGQEVEIDVTFTPPIFLPADHYFFRPEVQVSGGNFLYLSAPKPIVPPGTPFSQDLQSWIRNTNLKPDWSRIGTDITHQGPFNAAFSLAGDTILDAGTPGLGSCQSETISAITYQFGGTEPELGRIDRAALLLGFFSVDALNEGVSAFCQSTKTPM